MWFYRSLKDYCGLLASPEQLCKVGKVGIKQAGKLGSMQVIVFTLNDPSGEVKTRKGKKKRV